jgi:hypothetical protein
MSISSARRDDWLPIALDQEAIILRPIARFDKPGSRSRLSIYEVTRR